MKKPRYCNIVPPKELTPSYLTEVQEAIEDLQQLDQYALILGRGIERFLQGQTLGEFPYETLIHLDRLRSILFAWQDALKTILPRKRNKKANR